MADALSRLDMLADHPVSEEEVAKMFTADAQTFMKAFPLSYEDIAQRQTTDVFIRKALHEKLKGYEKTVYPSGEKKFTLVTKNGKIVLPTALQKQGVQWYHEALMHPGET